MTTFRKKNFPPDDTRRYLEPGPILLVSSAWKGETNIMTMGWHMMMGFSPALFGCYIWDANHSFEMIRRSKHCVINLPTTAHLNEVIGIGNSTGADIDKSEKFGLTLVDGAKVDAPLIKESNLLQVSALRFRQDQAPGYRAREIENEPNILTIIVLAFDFGLLGLCALAAISSAAYPRSRQRCWSFFCSAYRSGHQHGYGGEAGGLLGRGRDADVSSRIRSAGRGNPHSLVVPPLKLRPVR